MTTGADMERLAREIAGELTTAQRRAFANSTELGCWLSFYNARQALINKGLAVQTSSFNDYALDWTALGLAVRRILTERPNDADE